MPAGDLDMNRQLVGELISEAVAVLIIIAFGDSVACMYVLYDPSPYLNSYWGVCMAWGLGVTIAIYATGSVSGTHANPAVTLALATFRDFSWKKVLPYWVAQVIGAFAGAAIVYLLFSPVIDHFNQTHQLTRAGGGAAGVFFTHPQSRRGMRWLIRSCSPHFWSSASSPSASSTTRWLRARTPAR
jgi:glycerol uptake facilitator protein